MKRGCELFRLQLRNDTLWIGNWTIIEMINADTVIIQMVFWAKSRNKVTIINKYTILQKTNVASSVFYFFFKKKVCLILF